ncbi:hypothetical protein ACFODL_05890 [Phenylobacterium terrae]|uniref:Uncharacterized protein n=1 Tax=Phenylobacterium terrae TaxID=2665495 RepID=A0ABW4N7F5_9CAUL
MARLSFPAVSATALLLASASALVASPAVAQNCPEPGERAERPSAPARSSAPQRSRSRTPQQIQIDRGDEAYDAGRYDEAAAIYERLSRYPADRQRTAVRAKVKLARTEWRRGNTGRAEQLIAQVIASGDARAAAEARSLRADIAFQAGANSAEAEYERANALLAAGQLDAAESAFNALLNRGCPLREGFYDRVRLRLANVALERGDFAGARRIADQVNPNVSQNVAQNLARLRERIEQREIDAPVETALEALRTRPESDADEAAMAADAQAKVGELRRLASDNPRISPGLRQRLQLEESRQLARANQFAEARAVAEQVRSAPADPALGEQATAALTRIHDLEVAFNARRILAEGDALNAAGRYRAADAKFNELAAGADWPEEWRQRAKLRQAGLARRLQDYRRSDALIAEVEQAPASDSLRESAAGARASYVEATPLNDLRGGFTIGLRHDTDAVAVANAARDEDDEGVAFPAGEEFPDEALVWGVNGEYRRKLNDKYDYFMVSGGISGVEQFDLDDIDRVNLTVRAGPIFRLPEQAADVGFGLYYYRHWRGGEELHDNLGLWAQYRRAFEGFNVRVAGLAAKRDDERDVYDAWRYSFDLNLTSNRDDGYGPFANLEYDWRGAKDPSRESWAAGVSGGYRAGLGMLGDRPVSGDISAGYTRVEYQGSRVLAPGVIGAREDDRLRFGVGADVLLDENTVVRVGLEQLNNESNLPSQDRENTSIGISLRRTY